MMKVVVAEGVVVVVVMLWLSGFELVGRGTLLSGYSSFRHA